jgi:tetratricopeptide (TPR) repeat protein
LSVDLLAEERRRIEAGDPQSARRLAERALELNRGSGSAKLVAASAGILGECLFVIGEMAGARDLAGEALSLDEALGDPAAIAADLNLIGVLELTAGRPAEALPLLQRSYDLRLASLGPDHEETIESLNNLAVATWRSGAQQEAIAIHEDALRRCEASLGEGHRRTAETLNALAVKLQAMPDQQERARQLYERGLASAEAALGPDSELVGRLLVNVATARIDDGDLAGTAALLERALELHERHFGTMSRWTACPLDSIGKLALIEGRNEDARRAFERAYVIRVNELGPADPEALDAAINLASALSVLGGEGMNEASALYMAAMALQPEQNMGGLPRSALPALDMAADQLRMIATRLERGLQADPARAAAVARAGDLQAEADTAFLAGDIDLAADRIREAIGLLETARGASDPSMVEPLHRLKLVMRVGGKESGVLPILERIHAILTAAYGETHPLTIRALGELYWQQRREFGPAGGRDTAERIQQQVEGALGTDSQTGKAVSGAFEAARTSIPPDAEPWAEALSIRRERILAMPAPLADELLAGIDEIPWATLQHAYGPAVDTPRHLRLLLADDEQVRDDALDLLGESLLREDTVYPATVPAVRAIRRLVGDERVPARHRLIAFLAGANIAAQGSSGPAADELCASLADLPVMLRLLLSSSAEPAVSRAAAQALADLEG